MPWVLAKVLLGGLMAAEHALFINDDDDASEVADLVAGVPLIELIREALGKVQKALHACGYMLVEEGGYRNWVPPTHGLPVYRLSYSDDEVELALGVAPHRATVGVARKCDLPLPGGYAEITIHRLHHGIPTPAQVKVSAQGGVGGGAIYLVFNSREELEAEQARLAG